MTNNYNILIVDDDPNILDSFDIIIDGIPNAGVFTAINFEQTKDFVKKYRIDLAFIDIVLPDIDGYQVCRYIKENQKAYCIVMSSDKKYTLDKLKAYKAGAQQFIEKPFELMEIEFLIVNKLLFFDSVKQERETTDDKNSEIINLGDFSLNIATRKCLLCNSSVKLGENEFLILKHFLENPEQYFTLNEISNKIWNNTLSDSLESLRQTIFRLRQKISSDSQKRNYIVRIKPFGYKFFPSGDGNPEDD